MKDFEAKGVSFAYNNGENILDGIDMVCERGTVNVLLGLNGCGKTTLIKTMVGLYKPKNGTVTIDGRDLHSLSARERSRYVAYVKQHGNHVSGYSVMDYLLLSTVNTLKFFEEPGKKEMETVDRCLEALGILEMRSKNIGELSGGQRQLVYICAALVQNSDVILLDEPTSALDLKNQNVVIRQLKNIAKTTGKTIILSSHDPNHALKLGAHVFLMKGGKIIDDGPCSEMITAERLRPVYGDDICYSSDLPYREISFASH